MLEQIGRNAREASNTLAKIDLKTINNALKLMQQKLSESKTIILEANQKDIEANKEHLSKELVDRLTLTPSRIDGLIDQLDQVYHQPSPLNQTIRSFKGEQGFSLQTITVPIGVILMIYEARPNVTTEATSLALKSGNAIILRGSKTTMHTNKILVQLLHDAGIEAGLCHHFVQLVESTNHDDISQLVKMDTWIDVVIPRGGKALIQAVRNQSIIPVIETGTGNNFAYVDSTCDEAKAIEVIINAKASRPTVCNSLEKLLIQQSVTPSFMTKLNDALKQHHVLIKACSRCIEYFDQAQPFEDEDLNIEYYDYILGIKMVDELEDAIKIMNEHSSKHSNLILSNDFEAIQLFTQSIDSACVYVNASTRFSDGSEFGLGSEIGISTQKLHARGPMGLTALTSTKTIILGNYETR